LDNKNVVVASSDAEIYSVVQGDIKNRPCHKKMTATISAEQTDPATRKQNKRNVICETQIPQQR
jgi:hypothetical protein